VNGIPVSLQRLSRSSFARNVLVFMTGAAAAQAINVLASPVLTRLYDPASFGVFAIFVTLAHLLGITVTGRYEQAVVLPDSEEDAASIVALSFLSTLAVTLWISLLIWLVGTVFVGWLGIPELAPWLWLLPPYLIVLGLYNGLNYWSTRQNRFGRLSASQVFGGWGTVSFQIVAGWLRNGVAGLIGGKVIGQAAASAVLLIQVWRQDRYNPLQIASWSRIRAMARRYRDFPRYGMPQAVLNAFSTSLFSLLMTPFFGPAVIGYYALTQKVLALPVRLLSESIRQVFFPKASTLIRTKGDVRHFWRTTTLALLAAGVLPALVIMLFGPRLFAFVFGSEWYQAGVYARLIIPWTWVVLANPPSVMMMPVLGKQAVYMRYEMLSVVSRAVAIVAGIATGNDVAAIALFSAVGFLLNTGLMLYVMHLVSRLHPEKDSPLADEKSD
jgi:O-antigen/teichoic acid export membrane protein